MKTAKSYKIILLLTAFVLSIAAAFGMMSTATVQAATDESPSTYFTGTVASKANFGDNGLTASIVDGDTFGFKHDVIIGDFAMGMTIPKNVVLTITFTSDSYFIHGEKINDEYTTVIEYSVTLKSNDGGIFIKTELNDSYEIDVSGKNTFDFNVSVGNDNLPKAEGKILTNNKIKNIDDKAIATSIEFEFKVEEGKTVESGDDFVLSYINQKDSDGKDSAYNQKLSLEEGKLVKATPRVTLNDSLYTRQKDGSYKLVKIARSDFYSVSMKAYSPISSSSSGLRLFLFDSTDNVITKNYNDVAVLESNTATPDMVYFPVKGTVKVGVGIDENNDYQIVEPKLYETFSVEVVDKDSDDVIPAYVDVTTGDGKIAYDGFLNALKDEYSVTDENGDVTSVYLGATLEIPSMRDLVYDNITPFEKLTRKVYVNNGSASSSNSFDLDEIGDYFFYVTFTDEAGNAMDNEEFLKKDDSGKLVKVDDKTFTDTDKDLVFMFTMSDDAPISVEAAVEQGVGYKGVTYTASKFTVDASGCTLTYKLYYHSSTTAAADADGWKEIVKKSDATTDADKEVAYDGTLTFNPTKIGSYKIECVATSEVSSRHDEDFTIIRVKSEPKVVEIPSTWLKDNVWSVVFLSVGTLCLIGIIVLLFIKPKEETDND
ncbi:MAG: hypothetical protein IJV95_00325 [Clostridia bacterium]|nr:hypothetical protein [Clostridia bacterium]